MIDDHHGRTAGRATLLARAMDEIFGTHNHLLLAEQPPESPEQWERWWLQLARKAISADYLVHHGRPGSQPDDDQTRLVHASCQRGHLARRRRSTAQRT
jgi:RNA-directed DNA polymerase